MALNGGSKYLNTTVPSAGTLIPTVASTGIPMPTSDSANEVMAVQSLVTLPLVGAATDNTIRAFVLPANHIVVDVVVDVVTTAAAGAFTMGVLGQACPLLEGSALTLDALVANSTFTQSITVQSAAKTRGTVAIPVISTTSITKNASVGLPVGYDRVIGLLTGTAITTNLAVVNITLYIAAV
jgi:hypothetical protein